MNLHDNRKATKEAIQSITDVNKLQQMVLYLSERLAFVTTRCQLLKKDRQRLKHTVTRMAKQNIRYTVVTPDGFVLAR